MNKIICLTLVLFSTPLLLSAQTDNTSTSKVNIHDLRTIEVIGAASTELEPDQVYVSFTLKEYTKNNKPVSIETSEEEIRKIIKALNLTLSDLTVVNIYGYMNYNDGNGNSGVYQSRKSFRLKLNDFAKINEFISKVDKSSVESINIDESSHSDLSEHYQYVRTQAIIAAKEKACNLLQALGEKCGRVIQIEEMPATGNPLSQANTRYQGNESNSDTESHKITVSYQVKVKFEIK